MSNPFELQVGGTHYKRLCIQPFEFAMRNHWDFGAASILKYLTRFEDKAGKQDLEKCLHFIELRNALSHAIGESRSVIPMSQYVDANGITCSLHRRAFFHLENYAYFLFDAEVLREAVNDLMTDRYGEQMDLGIG